MGSGDANGVSDDGSLVVGASDNTAFRWTQENGMESLGVAPGTNHSVALGVSADGSVIVGESGYDAHLWTEGDGWVSLGNLGGGSAAHGVSSDGAVVVGWSSTPEGKEAFRWTDSAGMIGLGDLPGGNIDSEALAASANGSVIVGTGHNDLGEAAFVWDTGNGMRNLMDVLTVDFNLNLTDWWLLNAEGISADGLTIVGTGYNPDGNIEAWIAHIPEPATLWLLMLGGLAVIRRKRW